jgi:hypothetical protein
VSETDIASRAITELTRAASDIAHTASLVSITIDLVSAPPVSAIEVTTIRTTRTLIFLRADVFGPDGSLVAHASSVHKI